MRPGAPRLDQHRASLKPRAPRSAAPGPPPSVPEPARLPRSARIGRHRVCGWPSGSSTSSSRMQVVRSRDRERGQASPAPPVLRRAPRNIPVCGGRRSPARSPQLRRFGLVSTRDHSSRIPARDLNGCADMTRLAPPLLLGLLLAGCTSPSGWVPDVVVRGRLVHRAAAAQDGERERWAWQMTGGVRWRPGRVRAPLGPDEPRSAVHDEVVTPCLDPVLCAWERRQRERAIERALRRLGASTTEEMP